MNDKPIDKLLTVCTEDSLSVVDAYTLVDGLAGMVKEATVHLDGYEDGAGLYVLNGLAAKLLDKLEPKEKDDGKII